MINFFIQKIKISIYENLISIPEIRYCGTKNFRKKIPLTNEIDK